MAFTEQEKELIIWGRENGKSADEVKTALAKLRAGIEPTPTQTPATRSAGAEIINDLKDTARSVNRTINTGADRFAEIDQAQASGEQGSLRSMFQKFGTAASTAARAVGDVAIGAGKALLPQRAEDTVKNTALAVAEPVLSSKPVQNLIARFDSLKQSNPALARDIESALGIAELAGTVAGGGLARQGARASKEAVEASIQSLSIPPLPKLSIPSGTIAKELVSEIIPKASSLRENYIAKALGLAPVTDLANIKKATGNNVGEFLARNDLIKTTIPDTEKAIDDFYRRNYDTVRDAVALDDATYSFDDLPELGHLLDTLISDFSGKKSADFVNALERVQSIKDSQTFTLGQAQEIKSLFDQVESIYKRTGDVREALSAQDKANFIAPVRRFIEDRVKENVGVDIRPLNNNVQTARAIADAIETRSGKSATASMLSLADLNTLGFGSLLNPAVGVGALGARKMITAPSTQLRLARFFAGKSDELGGMTAKELREIESLIREELKKSISQ